MNRLLNTRAGAASGSRRLMPAIVGLLLLFSVAAAPAPPRPSSTVVATTLSSLSNLASSIDRSAQRSEWHAVRRDTEELSARWSAAKPTAVYGIRGKAHARHFDASLRWIQIASESHDAANVHRGRLQMDVAIDELAEALPAPHRR
jgi:hypothetical protein